jgi:methyl-accepting chemotaxis protein
MPFSWTFGRRLGAGFAVAAAALVVVAIFGYRAIHDLIDNQRWVAHSQQVRRELESLISSLKDAETGQRGYIITGEESFLQPYEEALPEIRREYDALRELTADNPEQQRRLESAKPHIDAKLAGLAANIAMRRSEGFEPTAAVVKRGDGKARMDELRKILGEMDEAETQLLERRRKEADASATLASGVILWGSALGLLFIVAVGLTIARSLSQQVGVAVRHIQSSSTELQAAATQQASGAREQASAMTEITTTIGELLATSRQIAESAERVNHIADLMAKAAKSGDSTVERGRESIGGIRQQVEVIVSHMLQLGKKSQMIGGVLDIVAELAEQTNILAINATIEAAGAGDAGKRFAVVADEIRKLADRVAGSAKEVRGLIEDVRAAVNTTVMTTETGAKSVEAGHKQFSEVASAFQQISVHVSTTSEAAKEIGLSTKQQATAVEQVNVAITNIAQASKETEVSTGQTLQTAAELTGLSQDLLRIVQAAAQSSGAHPSPRP